MIAKLCQTSEMRVLVGTVAELEPHLRQIEDGWTITEIHFAPDVWARLLNSAGLEQTDLRYLQGIPIHQNKALAAGRIFIKLERTMTRQQFGRALESFLAAVKPGAKGTAR